MAPQLDDLAALYERRSCRAPRSFIVGQVLTEGR
jgi:hypothetical protein